MKMTNFITIDGNVTNTCTFHYRSIHRIIKGLHEHNRAVCRGCGFEGEISIELLRLWHNQDTSEHVDEYLALKCRQTETRLTSTRIK
jgi:hypothetical protein